MQAQGGADDAHATHQLAAHLRQRTEHMFNTGTRRGDAAVTLLLGIRDTAFGTEFTLDTHAPAGFVRHCTVLPNIDRQDVQYYNGEILRYSNINRTYDDP
jgi:hypothetical protein